MTCPVHRIASSFTNAAAVAVDPALAAFAGDIARPRRAPPAARALDHLPGESGLVAGLTNVVRYSQRGADHVAAQRRRFGPVFRTVLGAVPQVWVCDVDLAARIGRNQDRAWSAALGWAALFGGINGSEGPLDALVALDFGAHADARKLLQPAFAPAALASYLELAQPLLERAVEEWTAQGRIAFKPEVRRLLAQVSSRIFIGDCDGADRLDRALADGWMGMLAIAKNPWISPTWRRAILGQRTLTSGLRAMVRERRALGGKDLFSRLCAEPGGVDWIDDDTMVRLFASVMYGAFDTTAAGLASMAYLLARYPEWQERLREELRAWSAAGPLTPEQARTLDATDRAWKETLRLYPVAGALPRVALRDVDLGGWRIPAGAMTLVMGGPAQRDASFWTDAERFDPDRFSDARAEDKRRPGVFMPFGTGAHACIGSQFATLEVKAFWRAMLTRCRFRMRSEGRVRHTYTPVGSVSGDVELTVERL
jgi:cytochrome P450